MKKLIIALLALSMLTACGSRQEQESAGETISEPALKNITPEEAKNLMDTAEGYVILDVRTPEEYAEGHIPGAILIPDTEIGIKAETTLKDKNQMILVYCRSGRRSKNAANRLAELGYTCIREFGGIIDWPYETVK